MLRSYFMHTIAFVYDYILRQYCPHVIHYYLVVVQTSSRLPVHRVVLQWGLLQCRVVVKQLTLCPARYKTQQLSSQPKLWHALCVVVTLR